MKHTPDKPHRRPLHQALHRHRWLLALLVFFLLPCQVAGATVSPAASLYDRTMTAVKENFHDKTFRGLPFDEIVAAGRRELKDEDARLPHVVGAVFAQLAP